MIVKIVGKYKTVWHILKDFPIHNPMFLVDIDLLMQYCGKNWEVVGISKNLNLLLRFIKIASKILKVRNLLFTYIIWFEIIFTSYMHKTRQFKMYVKKIQILPDSIQTFIIFCHIQQKPMYFALYHRG